MSNINDVAKRAGVSPTTAKRAIRTPDLLAPATLEKVRQAIDDLHYEPDQLAAALRRGQSKTIGLIVGSIVEPFLPNSPVPSARRCASGATRCSSPTASTTLKSNSSNSKPFTATASAD